MNRNCLNCNNPLPPKHRKYCKLCSPKASLLWKKRERRGYQGTAYWFDYWLSQTGDPETARCAYNTYMREYMREYRKH